jgi:hypothetical protein
MMKKAQQSKAAHLLIDMKQTKKESKELGAKYML